MKRLGVALIAACVGLLVHCNVEAKTDPRYEETTDEQYVTFTPRSGPKIMSKSTWTSV